MGYDPSNVPSLFKTIKWMSFTVNLDVGGGEMEDATLFLAEREVTNLVYDPNARPKDHNVRVIDTVLSRGGSDSLTLANVLNLIPTWKDRDVILYYCKYLVKNNSPVYVGVCEGDQSGKGELTSSGWQANLKLEEYEKAISNCFRIVSVSNSVITAIKESV